MVVLICTSLNPALSVATSIRHCPRNRFPYLTAAYEHMGYQLIIILRQAAEMYRERHGAVEDPPPSVNICQSKPIHSESNITS